MLFFCCSFRSFNLFFGWKIIFVSLGVDHLSLLLWCFFFNWTRCFSNQWSSWLWVFGHFLSWLLDIVFKTTHSSLFDFCLQLIHVKWVIMIFIWRESTIHIFKSLEFFFTVISCSFIFSLRQTLNWLLWRSWFDWLRNVEKRHLWLLSNNNWFWLG